MVMSSRSAFFLSREWLSKRAPASVVMSIRNGFVLPFCPLALSRKGHASSTTNLTLLSRRDRANFWWSTRLRVRELHPVFMQDMAWRRVVSCRQPSPWQILPIISAASCDPRLLPKASLHRGPSIMSSCETRGHSTNAMAPFYRAPLKLTIALFIGALSWVRRSCRSFFPRCAWRARESSDWTRVTTPTHTLSAPRLVWLSSISQSGWIFNGSSHCSRCPTRPSPPPPPPPPAPASTSRVPISLP